MSKLSEAIEFANKIHPLPRCEHGAALGDHAGEILEPPCGCRATDKQPAAETLEEITERIVRRQLNVRATAGLNPTQIGLYHAILLALRNRDERAACILEQAAMLASPVGVVPANDPEHERLQRLATILNSAARAIREGK